MVICIVVLGRFTLMVTGSIGSGVTFPLSCAEYAIGAGRRPVGPPAEGYALELRLADIKRWLEAEEARWAALAAAKNEP